MRLWYNKDKNTLSQTKVLKMKKYIILFFSLILVLCFSSCSLISDLPDTVTIDEKEYTRAFISEFFPVSKSLVNNNGVRVSGHIYYEYSNTPFDCYIAYGNDGFPNVYFESSAFNEAFSYYTDLNNLKFFCLFGNVHDENKQKIICVLRYQRGRTQRKN